MSSEIPRSYRRFGLWAIALGAASLFSLMDAGPTYLGHLAARQPITWTLTLVYTLSLWLTLGALVAPLVWFARKFRLDQGERWRSLLLHMLAAMALRSRISSELMWSERSCCLESRSTVRQ